MKTNTPELKNHDQMFEQIIKDGLNETNNPLGLSPETITVRENTKKEVDHTISHFSALILEGLKNEVEVISKKAEKKLRKTDKKLAKVIDKIKENNVLDLFKKQMESFENGKYVHSNGLIEYAQAA